jgi:hypothetical protein
MGTDFDQLFGTICLLWWMFASYIVCGDWD